MRYIQSICNKLAISFQKAETSSPFSRKRKLLQNRLYKKLFFLFLHRLFPIAILTLILSFIKAFLLLLLLIRSLLLIFRLLRSRIVKLLMSFNVSY
jgi:hypothetical protein